MITPGCQDAIVITGMGLVTSLGLDRESTWKAVQAGKCGVGPSPALESQLKSDLGAGQVPDDPDADDSIPREVHFLRKAINEALSDSALPPQHTSGRCAIVLGTTLHGMRNGGAFMRTGDFENLKRFLAGSTLASAATDLGTLGFSTTTCSACSSGLASIALARSLLRSGRFDIVIAGGYDPISEYAYAGFNSMRLVSPTRQRPFSTTRDGMKVAEGYAMVVLEKESDAVTRGARPLARLLGIGESCDAFHLSKPHPEGAGAAQAIRGALADAELSYRHIDLIIAHGTATPDNDASECAALSQVFGDHVTQIPLATFKSHLGHSLGAAGTVDLILGCLAMRDGIIPPSATIDDPEETLGPLQVCKGLPIRDRIDHFITTSLGFGGANVSVGVSRFQPSQVATFPKPRQSPSREAVITGIGAMLPGAIGNTALMELLADSDASNRIAELIDSEELTPFLNARRARRMSEYAKLAIAATGEALRDARVEDQSLFCEVCSAIWATMHGPSDFCETYYRQIVSEGLDAANPSLFAEGVPNVASAHLSTNFGIKGLCQTLIGTRTAGLDAIFLAATRIESGEWDRAIVGASEECTPLLKKIYRTSVPSSREPSKERPCRNGAVAFVLESADSAAERRAPVYARVTDFGSCSLQGENRRPRLPLGIFDSNARSLRLSSGTGTFLDRMERLALRSTARRGAGERSVPSASRFAGELFSVLPLANLACVLLQGRYHKNEGPAASSARSLQIGCADPFGRISLLEVAPVNTQIP